MRRIPAEEYKQVIGKLIYDESSPSCLRWATSGKPAGSPDHFGYFLVRIGPKPGRLLKAHRIVWFLHHGAVPDLLDHVDGNTGNNRIQNLREATEGQNRRNSRKHTDNTSGHKGVYWDKRTAMWMAKVTVDYKSYWGGRFTDKQDAINKANELRQIHHKDFLRHV